VTTQLQLVIIIIIIIIIIINRQALQRGRKINLFFNFVLFSDVTYLVINAGVFFSIVAGGNREVSNAMY